MIEAKCYNLNVVSLVNKIVLFATMVMHHILKKSIQIIIIDLINIFNYTIHTTNIIMIINNQYIL